MSKGALMSSPLDPLVRDFVSWIAQSPRPYAEALDAWRTSCPRLTVWEDATERGLIERTTLPELGPCLTVTPSGQDFLRSHQG